MTQDAENKARRRRNLKEAYPAPLNQIALRYVDAVQALEEEQRAILAAVLAQVGVKHLSQCLVALKSSEGLVQNEADLLELLHLPQISRPADQSSDFQVAEEIDMDYLASLLARCYPDMPEASAEALSASEVMDQAARVVSATRRALGDARSDFVITVLYTLFEDRLHAIEKTIAGNPSFIKAMQLSRPHWKPTQLTQRN